VLAPLVGRMVDSRHPRPIIGFGFAVLTAALWWLSVEMTPSTPIWRLAVPLAVVGVAMAFIWAPLSATATRNLPARLAGAGSGVYNTTRQVGAVLGSASMAALMSARVSAEIPRADPATHSDVMHIPPALHDPFALAMSQSMVLPVLATLFGLLAAMFLIGPQFGPGRPQSKSTAGLR